MDLQSCFVNFFEHRAAYPIFKQKSKRQSANYTHRGFRFDPLTKTLTIAKIGNCTSAGRATRYRCLVGPIIKARPAS